MAIVNKAVMDTGIWVSESLFSFLCCSIYVKVELLNLRIILWFTLGGAARLFSRASASVYEGFQFFCILTNSCYFLFCF